MEAERETAAGHRRGADNELAARETLALAKNHLVHGGPLYDLLPVVAPPAAMWAYSPSLTKGPRWRCRSGGESPSGPPPWYGRKMC